MILVLLLEIFILLLELGVLLLELLDLGMNLLELLDLAMEMLGMNLFEILDLLSGRASDRSRASRSASRRASGPAVIIAGDLVFITRYLLPLSASVSV